MIFPKAWQSLQNLHGILQRWMDRFLPNAEKRQAREILRLICRKCHAEKTGTESGTDAPKRNLPWKRKRFLHISWEEWKGRKWLAVICHPVFLQRQYSPEVLVGLCGFLQEESQLRPEGIGQDLYFVPGRAKGQGRDGVGDAVCRNMYLYECYISGMK